MPLHPEWYEGLTPNSSMVDIQLFIYSSAGNKNCSMPCAQLSAPWCRQAADAPALWAPSGGGAPEKIKILTYNLFWWSLFGRRHGNNHSAGTLIKDHMSDAPFDVMGFQECEDLPRVLKPVGLLDTYGVIMDKFAICMAYSKKAWTLIERGLVEVAEDMVTKYYGRRGAQWMRLKSLTSNRSLFFMNHHGPLSINSGGRCGGQATAYNLLSVVAKHAQVGDTLILVGDFNANAASSTIQTLWKKLVQTFAGESWGGVDNIFTNVPSTNVIKRKIMGSGGSDHEAIYAVLQLGEDKLKKSTAQVPLESVRQLTGKAKPGYEWQHFWCGRIEDNTEYAFDPSAWSQVFVQSKAANDPERCCRECQANARCKAWLWKDWAAEAQGKQCMMSGTEPISQKAVNGYVSGLTYVAAAAAALESAQHAITRV